MNQTGDWYATTAPENKYLYNGKELDENLGLNWYHYGFRMYDAAIGRFPCVDPIADQFPHVSPYNYAENEPIANIDLHGLQAMLYQIVEVMDRIKNLLSPSVDKFNNIERNENHQQRAQLFRKGLSNNALGIGGTLAGAGVIIGSEGTASPAGATMMVFSLTETSIGISQMADALFGEGEANSVLHKSTSLPGIIAYSAGSEYASLLDVSGEVFPALLGGGLSSAVGIDDAIESGKSLINAQILSAGFKAFQANDAYNDFTGLVEETGNVVKLKLDYDMPVQSGAPLTSKEIKDIKNFVNQLPDGN